MQRNWTFHRAVLIGMTLLAASGCSLSSSFQRGGLAKTAENPWSAGDYDSSESLPTYPAYRFAGSPADTSAGESRRVSSTQFPGRLTSGGC